jgi:predicted transcriptional regulator
MTIDKIKGDVLNARIIASRTKPESEPKRRLSRTKVSHIIAKNPISMNVLKFKPKDKVNKIVKAVKDFNYKVVMITDESERKVLGLFFISDLLKIKSEGDLLYVDHTVNHLLYASSSMMVLAYLFL